MADDVLKYFDDAPVHPQGSLGSCATLACIWEATAAKPGNVYRGADFADLTYADFVTCATFLGPLIDFANATGSIGHTVLEGTRICQAAIGPKNCNLGILLLFAPIAAGPWEYPLSESVAIALENLEEDDARDVYAAIRLANPGGLGRVEEGDVYDPTTETMPLLEAMQLAADRDLVARQYVNGFVEVFWTAERIAAAVERMPLGDAIIRGYLELVAAHPDSLIARKCGVEMAQAASTRASAVLSAAERDESAYSDALADFDFWLRADGNRRNPGTSADIVAASLFVLLIERRIKWPVKFN